MAGDRLSRSAGAGMARAVAMIADPIREGLASGWSVIDASQPSHDATLEADVAIVGTGAGGGIVAEALCDAGLRVVMIEEGPLRSSSDFRMREADAYRDLYQESAARKTADKAINIYQGRCVGGGTTVNWTSASRRASASRRGVRRRTRTMPHSPAAPERWACASARSGATCAHAGISAIAAWAAPPTRSSRCSSRRSLTRSRAARRS